MPDDHAPDKPTTQAPAPATPKPSRFPASLVSLVILFVAASLGYQTMRVRQMATQYSWAFEKRGLAWKGR